MQQVVFLTIATTGIPCFCSFQLNEKRMELNNTVSSLMLKVMFIYFSLIPITSSTGSVNAIP